MLTHLHPHRSPLRHRPEYIDGAKNREKKGFSPGGSLTFRGTSPEHEVPDRSLKGQPESSDLGRSKSRGGEGKKKASQVHSEAGGSEKKKR